MSLQDVNPINKYLETLGQKQAFSIYYKQVSRKIRGYFRISLFFFIWRDKLKNHKKIKLGKLNFYIVDDNYIEYLSKFDKHIAYNKNEKRPYIGVVILVKEHYYFAPMFSPKQRHKTYKDNLTFFKMKSIKDKNDLGIIRFSDMIPVPQDNVELLDVKDKPYAYRRLLSEQYKYINLPDNRQKIMDKADRLYTVVTSNSKGKTAKFYKQLSCDFKLLEEQSLKYNI